MNSWSVSISSVACHYWSVAVLIIRRQSVLLLAFLQAEWIPVLYINTLILLSQVAHGHPWGLLRWSGGWNGALMTQWWSCLLSAHAMCPRKWSWLLGIREETGGQPAVFLHWPWLHVWCMGSEGFYRVTTCQKHLTWQVFFKVPSFGPIHQHPEEIQACQPLLLDGCIYCLYLVALPSFYFSYIKQLGEILAVIFSK